MEERDMINKKNYLMKVKEISDIAKKNGFDKILNKVNECTKEMDQFSLKILFVGGFSAGKSALINTMLDRDLLVEDQKPETAIASEVIFDNIEYVELIDDEGKSTKCELDEVENFDFDKYRFLKYHINNEWLANFKNYSFVDMPGFNSGIERHNKAIMNYVGQGNAYVLVIDCEDGDIKFSVIDFMKEIKQYDNNLSIVVSKTDKKAKSHIDSVIEQISSTASSILDKNVKVVGASKYDNANEEISSMIQAFDDQDIFEQKFRPRISEIGNLCCAAIENIAKTAEYDDSDIQKEIKRRAKEKEKLSNQLSKERRKLSMKMKNQVKPSILGDVENALRTNSEALASAIIAGGDSFTRNVNNLLRPVLITSTKRYTEESFLEFGEQIDLSEVFSNDNAEDVANSVSTRYSEVSSNINKIISNADLGSKGKSKKGNSTYKSVVGILSITTEVVAPWIELLIVFLPEILKTFGKLFQSDPLDVVKRKVENDLIPQIVSKIEMEIDESLNELETQILGELEEKIGKLLDVETEALKLALEMKNKEKKKFEQLVTEAKSDVQKIEAIIDNL